MKLCLLFMDTIGDTLGNILLWGFIGYAILRIAWSVFRRIFRGDFFEKPSIYYDSLPKNSKHNFVMLKGIGIFLLCFLILAWLLTSGNNPYHEYVLKFDYSETKGVITKVEHTQESYEENDGRTGGVVAVCYFYYQFYVGEKLVKSRGEERGQSIPDELANFEGDIMPVNIRYKGNNPNINKVTNWDTKESPSLGWFVFDQISTLLLFIGLSFGLARTLTKAELKKI